MTEIQKYLAEEVAEDLADGIITRREAMRRLGLLGLTASAASGLLVSFAECAGGCGRTGDRGQRGAGGTETAWAPVARESITFPARACRCWPRGRRPPRHAVACS